MITFSSGQIYSPPSLIIPPQINLLRLSTFHQDVHIEETDIYYNDSVRLYIVYGGCTLSHLQQEHELKLVYSIEGYGSLLRQACALKFEDDTV
ncbi:unnamed protein product [Didymodactylos carnosus]|uniref:Uncharacterized protein n=1 Tax=Didymodactylos carnosus TaxID=1234261 RepID=A0A813WCK6_9BILA|nr:unnamed protein product [Didymodactylos carnosus]CAF1124293.1 unnamed protein product [Didymodactylos carnosus]CAF3637946.1 unnamed protein product [Didymodactylos carnosus]CAF3900677.1 unnamed protein product [Didymodactylos carnosus]